MALTYRQLIVELNSLPKDRLDDDVTVYVADVDEFFHLAEDHPVVINASDVLDEGHMYLVI